MVRTTLTIQRLPGEADYDGAVLTTTAADTTNQNDCAWTGGMVLIAHNDGVSSRTVTVTASADDLGRSTNISDSIGAGTIVTYGPFKTGNGWRQSDGMLYFEADHADVKFAVIQT